MKLQDANEVEKDIQEAKNSIKSNSLYQHNLGKPVLGEAKNEIDLESLIRGKEKMHK